MWYCSYIFIYNYLILLFISLIKSKQIPLIGLFTRDNQENNNYSSSSLIIDYAIQHLKTIKSLHTELTIQRHEQDIPCDMAIGTKLIFDMIHRSPRPLAIFSGSCQTVASAIAETAGIYDMTIVIYSETSSLFTAREKYPSLIRTVPGDSQHNIARKLLLRKYNWRRFGILYQYERQYTMPVTRFNDLLQDETGWENALSRGISFNDLDETQGNRTRNSLKDTFDELQRNNIRIILGNFNSTMAIRIFCEAFRYHLFGSRFQWIIVGYYEPEWWLNNPGPCNTSEILYALNGTLQTRVAKLGYYVNTRTIADLTPDQFNFDLSILKTSNYFVGYAFDAILTLTSAFEKLKDCPDQFHIDSVWRQSCWRHELINIIKATDIEGVTGRIRFNNGDRIGEIVIEQILVYHSYKSTVVDIVQLFVALPTNQSKYILLPARNERNITWHGHGPPNDRIRRIELDQRISILTYAIMASISGIGIFLAIGFFVFNIIFRTHRFIRMSSPQINNLIIAGCILSYTSVLLMGIDSTLLGKRSSESAMNFICAARVWTLSIGFTISFGAILSKTWRVHTIFTKIHASKRAIKDYRLFIFVGILFAIDTVLLTSWQIVDPLKVFKDISQTQTKDEDVVILWIYEECRSNRRPIWITMLSIYKGVLMVAGSRFAWATRNVRITALNDSAYVGMSLYNVVLLSITTAVVGYFLRDQHERSYIITSVFILLCVTITLCLVFVPKVLEVAKDPRSKAKPQHAIITSARRRLSRDKRYVKQQPKLSIKSLTSQNEMLRLNATRCDELINRLSSAIADPHYKAYRYEIYIHINQPARSSKSSFDAQFYRGRCPDYFYQIGDECLYFGTDGKKYSWYQTQNICAIRIARLLEHQAKFVIGGINIKPNKGVRQLILNTPEKTKILEALYREYDELNFAIRLPSDYNTLQRCHDGKEDNWPQYCVNLDSSNGTCFETSGLDSNHICLRHIDCDIRYLRFACEFTLPGNSELSASKFRNCPKGHGLRRRLPIWAWLLVAVGAMLLLLLILGGVLAFIRNSKKELPQTRKSISETLRTDKEAIHITGNRDEPTIEPVLVRSARTSISNTDYLEPQQLKRMIPPTIKIRTASIGQDSTSPSV
ncbi:unnamed protein product [Rotaria sp. Silwood2]|nr:unnamed protein product [Rotaria sp. Silwood2]